ncbi:MAG: DUF1127 domain-containing protein [Pontibacterium sp.]
MTHLLKKLLRRCGALLYLWQERHRQRAVLKNLSKDQLSDLGLSKYDAVQEASKPFWKA